MGDKQGVCLYVSFWISFFCSPHGNILLKPWDEFLLGSQDVNVNFLPVAKETLSHRGPGSLPHGHHAFSQRSLFCFLSPPFGNQTPSNISASGCSVDWETPTSGGCVDFQRGRMSPQWAIHRTCFSTRPISCMHVFWGHGVVAVTLI